MTGPERSLTMRMARTAAVLLLLGVVAFSGACKKRKPKLPPETTPPPLTVPQPQPAPPPATTPTNPAPTTPSTTTTTTTPVVKPKPKHHVAHKPKPPAPAPQTTPPPQQPSQATSQQQQSAKANPPANGNPDAMTISPDLPKTEVDAQKRDTEQLLQNAEGDLRKVTRALSDGEQEMVRNARNYITQSRLATQDGDLERAHKLAVKAKLLSAELVK